MRPDAMGRIPLQALGLLLGVEDGQAVCWEGDTGRRLLDWEELQCELTADREATEWAKEVAREAKAATESAMEAIRKDKAATERAMAATARGNEALAAVERRTHELEAEVRRLRAQQP